MAALNQTALLQQQEEELQELRIPTPEGTLVQPNQGSVSEAGGVPFARSPKVAAQIKSLNTVIDDTESRLTGLDKKANSAAFNAATGLLRQAQSRLDVLSGSSAPLPRPEAKRIYADGSSHGFIALSDASGKVKKVLFANGPGGTTVPTMEDVVNMMTQPVENSASADLKKQAGAAVERYTLEMQRRGASPDMLNYFGEFIQEEREEQALKNTDVTERVNNPARDRRVAANGMMKVLFDDFKQSDLQDPGTRTVDPAENAEQMKSMGRTLQDLYSRVKNSPEITGKGSMRAVLLSGLLEGHKETLQSYGKNGAFRAVTSLINGIDGMRATNFQQEIAQTEAVHASELDAFTNTAANKIARSAATMDPVGLVQKVNEAQGNFIDFDSIDRLGSIKMSHRVGQSLNEAQNEIKEQLEFSKGSTPRNTTVAQQKNFVTKALISMMGQELAQAPRQERHVYMDMVTGMNEALEADNFDSAFPHLTGLRDSLHKKYFAGINIASVERMKFDMDNQKALAKRKAEATRRLKAGQWLEKADSGKVVWMSGTEKQARDGRKRMAKEPEVWARLEGDFGDVQDVQDLMNQVGQERDREEQQAAIKSIRQSRNVVLQNIPVAGGINAPVVRPPSTPPAQGQSAIQSDTQQQDVALKALYREANRPLPEGQTEEARQRRVRGKVEQLAGRFNLTTEEINQFLGNNSPNT
jgi:hypothetical protein